MLPNFEKSQSQNESTQYEENNDPEIPMIQQRYRCSPDPIRHILILNFLRVVLQLFFGRFFKEMVHKMTHINNESTYPPEPI